MKQSVSFFLLLFALSAKAQDSVRCTSTYADISKVPYTEVPGPELIVIKDEKGQGSGRVEDTKKEIAYTLSYNWNTADAQLGFTTLSLSETTMSMAKLYHLNDIQFAFIKKSFGRQFGIWITCGSI